MPTIDKPYIKIYHNEPELKTVGDFVDNNGNSIAKKFIDKEEEFLDYDGGTGLTNRNRIFNKYFEIENENESGKPASQLLLKLGTELLIPKAEIEISNLFAFAIEPYDTSNFNTFVSQNLRDLLNNPNYKSVYSQGKLGRAIDFYPQISVWMWIRVLNQFIDVSPFIQQVDTSSQKDGSSFSFILAPIVGQRTEEGWKIRKTSITNYNSNTLRGNYSADSKLFKLDDKGNFKENNFYFHNIISPNDLVFIRYETLSLEASKRNKDQERFTVGENDIPNKVYDLIGMVDNNQLTVQPQTSEISINISGRDLTKTILDDGSYFYIEEFVSNIFANKDLSSKLAGRIYGKIETFTTLGQRSLAQSINLVVNQFAATGYVPESVFRGYGGRRNQIEEVNNDAQVQYESTLELYKKDALAPIENSRIFYNIEEASNTDRINGLFNVMVGLEEAGNLTQDGVITDTAVDELDGFLFDRDRLTSAITTTASPERPAITSVKAYVQYKSNKPQGFTETNLRDGVWQIIDVEVDESVANIRLADTSIAEANGSLINTIQSFCDEPFVEFFTDTYGDRFKFIARRPPFTKKSFKELAEVCESVVLEPEDIISQNLQFNEEDVYSYYILRPQGFLGGTGQGDTYSLGFLPAIVLKEYVDMFGARPYDKVTNYIPYAPKNADNKVNIERRQIVNDLKYMVDSTVYMPFTRKGTIVINGDRRIKKNTIVYNKMTDELCYVKSVSHSYIKNASTIDRTTTLQVDRCMVKKYIEGKNVDGIENKVSYFNIAQTNIQERFFIGEGTSTVEVLENWDLTRNRDGKAEIFDFFLQKRQFE